MGENFDQNKNLIFHQNRIPHLGSLLSNTRQRTEYQNMCSQRQQLRWRTRTPTCERNESKTDFCKAVRGLTSVWQGFVPKVTSFVAGLSQEPS